MPPSPGSSEPQSQARPPHGEVSSMDEAAPARASIRSAMSTQAVLAAIVESSEDAIVGKDLDGIVISWNAGAQRMYGYTPAEVVGQPISILFPPGHEDELPAIMDRLRRGEGIEHYETVRRARDGRLLDVSLTISPIRDDRGRLIGASAIARDITVRRRAEARWRLLSDLGEALVQDTEASTVLRELARLLVRGFADYCIVYVLDGNDLRRAAAAHADPLCEPLMQRLTEKTPPSLDDASGVGAVVRTGQAVLASEIADDTLALLPGDPEYVDLIRTLRPRSSIIVPMRARGRTVGALAIAATDRSGRRYDEADLVLCREFAERASLAIDSARLFVRSREELLLRQRAEAELQRRYDRLGVLFDMTAAIVGSAALSEIYGQAIDGLRRTLDVDRVSILLLDGDGIMRFEAWRNLSRRYREAVEGHTPWTLDGRDPEPLAIADVEFDSTLDPDLRTTVLEEGIRALAFIPLVFRGQLLGKFMLYFDTPRVLTAEELELARTIAGTIAVAIVRARDEQRLREARESAEHASAAKSQFLGIMSHELRTPLNAIMGYTELLLMGTAGDLTQAQSTHLERIRTSVRHQAELVDEVLTYARLEAGHEEVRSRIIDLVDTLRGMADLVRPDAELRGIALRAELPQAPVRIRTDPARLRQIVLNLLGNAAKYTEQGEIVLRARRVDDDIVVEVRDTGPGIPPDKLDYIFAPFTRVDESRTRLTPGTGLGLAIVRRLVTLLGGEVRVDSRVGEGSTFRVRLPTRAGDGAGERAAASTVGSA